MFKLLLWVFVAFVVMLICSKITLDTSIYKAEQNRLEIIFPQWNTEHPWIYFYWTPGTVKWHQDANDDQDSDDGIAIEDSGDPNGEDMAQ